MPRSLHPDGVHLRTGHRPVIETANGSCVARVSVQIILKTTGWGSVGRRTRDLGQLKVPMPVETETTRRFHRNADGSVSVKSHVHVLSGVLTAYSGHSRGPTGNGHIVSNTCALSVRRGQRKVQEINPQLTNIRVRSSHVDRTPVGK